MINGVFHKSGVPQNQWFMMKKTIEMHDLGVPPFAEPSNGAKQRIQSCVVICSDYFPAIESSAKALTMLNSLIKFRLHMPSLCTKRTLATQVASPAMPCVTSARTIWGWDNFGGIPRFWWICPSSTTPCSPNECCSSSHRPHGGCSAC